MDSITPDDEPLRQAPTLTPDQLLQQAVAQHQAGQLLEAEKLYRTLLQADPGHAVANHNMGALAVQMKLPAAGLPHFSAALEADPAQAQYWLSYIDALIQTGEVEAAREILTLARQQGLEGRDVEALALRLENGAGTPEQEHAGYAHAAVDSPPDSAAADDRRGAKPSGNAGQRKGAAPPRKQIDSLVALFTAGRFAEAEKQAREMASRFPKHWIGWKMLGVLYQQMGRNADALLPMQKAVQLSPQDAEAQNNLGIILTNLGRLEESVASYRRALQISRNYAQAHSNLGATLQKLGRLEEAEASYRQALRIDPNYVKAHGNLGAIMHELKRLDEAEASYRRALQLNRNDADTHRNLGITLMELGRLDEAEASVRQALEINPHDVAAHDNLGAVLLGRGLAAEAEACFRRTLELAPDNFEAYNNLGVVLLELGRTVEAETSLRRALAIKPEYAEALSNLGISLRDQGRLEESEAAYRHALAIAPDFPDALGNLGGVLHDLGRVDESVASYRRALQIDPDCGRTHSNLLFGLSQTAEIGPQALFAEHCRFGTQFESRLRAGWPSFDGPRDPERVLRVGFVSGDFRNHAMAYFIEPVLKALSEFPRLSLHAYSNHVIEDAVTLRLRSCFARWASIAGQRDAAAAARIANDGIDILIDLSGHTAKNRLVAFAHKPAPVQASWMGYPGTTGLSAMDYYLADRFFLPAGQFDDQFTEKIARLPANAPFMPSREAPPVGRLPALDKGHLTFGSFNRVGKLSHSVVSVWSKLLRALPESRMLLGAMREGERYDTLIEWFEREGVARQRLDFAPRSDMKTYLGQHHQVDICLDTFPYNGGTTTLHALWMGVPTMTLTGNTTASRTGSLILGHVGLEEFVARDADDFMRKGVPWANRLEALAQTRAGLRQRIEMSAISQPQLIAAGLEQALRIMWRRWCAKLPPESFEVSTEYLTARMREPTA